MPIAFSTVIRFGSIHCGTVFGVDADPSASAARGLSESSPLGVPEQPKADCCRCPQPLSRLMVQTCSSPLWRSGGSLLPCLALLACLAPAAWANPAEASAGEPEPAEPTATPEKATEHSASDAWRGTVELYGFAPLRVTGSTTIRGFEADTDFNLGDIFSSLQWATSLRGSVERGRWGLLTDLSYVRLGEDAARTTPGERFTGRARVSTTQGIYDLAVRYRLGEVESAVAAPGAFSVIPYLGVRVIDARLNASAEIQGNGPRELSFEREGTFGRTWAQPLAGLQGTVFLAPRLRAFARADVGGFGLSGAKDLSGNAQIGLGYAVGNNTDLNLSWRYMSLQYQNNKNPDSGFSSYQNGIELGLKFFF